MKKSVFVLIMVSLFLNVMASDLSLVNIKFKDKNDVTFLSNQGYEITAVRKDVVEVIVPKNIINDLKEKFELKVVLKDIDTIFRRYKGKSIDSDSIYHTYDEVVEFIDQITKDYPEISKKISIGKSYEGREIVGIKISDNVKYDEEEPSALFMGGHHSREWIANEVPIAIAQYLLENYADSKKVQEYVNNYEIFIVPMVNPDGINYSQFNYSYWRKTRRDLGNNNFGVDPNRNYGYHWGESGASSYPGSDTYKGEKPFSEKCTQAVRDLALWRKFDVSISFHSYGGEILYPFSYSGTVDAPDHDHLKEIAEGMADLNGYNAIKSAELYPAAGDSDDWLYTEIGTFAFTFELGRSFVPSDYLVDEICEKNVKSALYLIDNIENIIDYKKNK